MIEKHDTNVFHFSTHETFWTTADLEEKLIDFQHYYNGHRTYAGLEGRLPEPPAGGVRDCIKHGGGHMMGSAMVCCFRNSGCHSRNKVSSRLLSTAQRTCNNRWAPGADQRMG